MLGSMRVHEVLAGIFETTGLTRLYFGTNAARSASTDYHEGVAWWTSDTHDLYIGTGSAWQHVGGASGAPPGSHGPSHQHGGADEVATATPGANVIPKAGAGGRLAAGFLQEVLAYADLTDDPLADHVAAADPHSVYALDTDLTDHAAIAAAHHARYTDGEVDTIVATHAAIAAAHHALVSIGADAAHSLTGQVLSAVLAGAAQVGHVGTGVQTWAGVKTFGSIPVLPGSNPTSGNQATRKTYVDARRSRLQYVFVPDAAAGADVDTGNQQGAIHHSGPDGDTATRLYVDCETAPGTSVVVTVQYGNTDDLDTVASWTTIATVTASGKTTIQNSMSNASIPADRLIRMNVGTITGTDPKDMTVTLRTTRAVGA